MALHNAGRPLSKTNPAGRISIQLILVKEVTLEEEPASDGPSSSAHQYVAVIVIIWVHLFHAAFCAFPNLA